MPLVKSVENFAAKFLPDRIKRVVKPYIRNRIYKILSHIDSNDSVLSLGCVKHSLEEQDVGDPTSFLFTALHQTARRAVGVDILEDEVEELRKQGYEVHVEDVQQLNLNERFDKIVAGEIIEHLSNPGLFFDSCRNHLEDDGKLIVTTPNPRRLPMLIWFLSDNPEPGNSEHTMWFDWFVMAELAGRHGFEIDRCKEYSPGFHPITLVLYHLGIARDLTSGGWVFVLSKKSEPN